MDYISRDWETHSGVVFCLTRLQPLGNYTGGKGDRTMGPEIMRPLAMLTAPELLQERKKQSTPGGQDLCSCEVNPPEGSITFKSNQIQGEGGQARWRGAGQAVKIPAGSRVRQSTSRTEHHPLRSASFFTYIHCPLNVLPDESFGASQVAVVVNSPVCQCERQKRCGFDP